MPRSRVLAGFALALAALCGPWMTPAHAVELNYTWKTGDVHRFRYQEDTQFKLPTVAGLALGRFAGGSAGALTVQVRTTFAQKVLQIKPDGSARVELRIEQLEFTQGKGKPVDALAPLPEAARTVQADVDRKGHVRPERAVVIYQHEGRYFLGAQASGEVEDGLSASASASATLPNGQKVEVYASLDLQGGKVSGGVRAAGNAVAAKTVKITAEDPALDVLPRRLFDLLVLPDGNIAPGSTTEVKLPLVGSTLRLSLAPLEGQVAPLRYQVGTQVAVSSEAADRATSGGDPTAGFAGADSTLGSLTGGGDPTAGFAGADSPVGSLRDAEGVIGGDDAVVGTRLKKSGRPAGPADGGGVSAGLQFGMDLRSRFDTAAGKLLEVKGTVHTSTQQGNGAGVGAGITVDATITLTRL